MSTAAAKKPVPPADPIAAAVARAPRVQRLTPEQRAELDRDLEDIRTGRARLIPHAKHGRALEELEPTDGE